MLGGLSLACQTISSKVVLALATSSNSISDARLILELPLFNMMITCLSAAVYLASRSACTRFDNDVVVGLLWPPGGANCWRTLAYDRVGGVGAARFDVSAGCAPLSLCRIVLLATLSTLMAVCLATQFKAVRFVVIFATTLSTLLAIVSSVTLVIWLVERLFMFPTL